MTTSVLGWLGDPPAPLRFLVESRSGRVARQLDPERWPVLAVPARIARLYGVSPERAEALLDGCKLFYLSADVIDDAQDGDLPADVTWPQAINAGNAFLFGAMAAFAAAAPGAPVANEIGQAGLALASGQALDLASSWDMPMSETEVLSSVRQKSGASMRLYTRMAALAADQRDEIVDLWGKLGDTWGTMTQLKSDLLDLEEPQSRDLRNRKATLPIAYVLARHPAATRAALQDQDRSRLLALLRTSGALTFVELAIDAMALEIEGLLGHIPLSAAGREEFIALSRQASESAVI